MDSPGCKKIVGNEASAEQHVADATSLCRETGIETQDVAEPDSTSHRFAANHSRACLQQISITTVALLAQRLVFLFCCRVYCRGGLSLSQVDGLHRIRHRLRDVFPPSDSRCEACIRQQCYERLGVWAVERRIAGFGLRRG